MNKDEQRRAEFRKKAQELLETINKGSDAQETITTLANALENEYWRGWDRRSESENRSMR